MTEELELEIVELGDAKEETKGTQQTLIHEANPGVQFRPAE